MKNPILSLTALCGMAVILTSCDSRAKLSDSVQGIWAGTPQQMTDTGAAKATVTRLMEFTKTDDAGAGNITLTAYITVENTMSANDSIVTPLTITASGTASITGVYQAKDDDDILLNLDTSSLTVNVDPEAVQLNYNVLTTGSQPQLVALKPAASVLATQQITRAAQSAFFNLREIEDIKIHGSIMTCEFGHQDFTFSRQEESRP